LATEAFVTVPLIDLAAPALAIRSNFYEFQSAESAQANGDATCLLAHELSEGAHYRVVVTTDGGLYRYQLNDEVQVVGFKAEVPLLKFLGKTDEVSDLVGEKLNAAHVQSVLQTAFREIQLVPTFSQLHAVRASPPGYTLQIVAPALSEKLQLQRQLRDAVESGLNSNPAYRYARSLGQLRPLAIDLLDQRQADAHTTAQTAARVATGKRLGDIKPATITALVE
jgi:hypothetical protein